MTLWNHDDVHWPERARVAKSKNFVGLGYDFDRRPTTERLIAIEIPAHHALRLPAAG